MNMSETEDVRYILDEDKRSYRKILRMDGITSIKGDQLINYIIEAVQEESMVSLFSLRH